MISRKDKANFLVAHWDWLVAGVCILLCGAFAFLWVRASNVDPEDAAIEKIESLGRGRSKVAIDEVDMKEYDHAMKVLVSPATLTEPAETMGGFLASDPRVFCEQGDAQAAEKACGLPIIKGLKICPFCNAKQPVEAKIVLDSDGDGIPDELEVKWGMNPNDASDADLDMDGDGFSNHEEFVAGTDPTKKHLHPSYLKSLAIQSPLKETLLPFYFEKARPTPSGVRLDFKDPKKKNDFGRSGVTYSVLLNEPIGKTGFIAKNYEKKSQKTKIDGANVSKEVDVSVVTIERVSDKKKLQLTVQDKRRVAVDIQAKLVYSRNGMKEFIVVPGDTIDLHGTPYKILMITREGQKAKVLLDSEAEGKVTLEANEP